jgi:uncharacterized LabA/DUF88 family protein
MKTTEKRLLDILEPAGLALLIRGALGRTEMIRIANASRVSVPGMRNRSVSLEHLSEALADKFVAEGPCRKTILKALTNAVRTLLPAYRKQDVEELRLRLTDAERVRADSELGKLLFLLLTEPREGIATEEIRTAVLEATRAPGPREPGAPPSATPAETEIQALRREKAELSRRAADLVALVDRLRERDRRFREEIAQRKFDVNNFKLQLAKAKRERESLEKEVRSLTGRLDQAEKKPVLPQDLSASLAASLAETRRVASAMEKLQSRLREERAAPVTAALARSIEELKRETSELKKALGAEKERSSKAIEELPGRIADAVRAPGSEARAKTAVDRVGVFVDVQNMFYAARGVNARLDFDLLLQATTRNRRLIRAVAYVVEAREIDQSGFIALLKTKRYEVKRKDLKVRSDGSFKGDWDMEIALDALEMADVLDVVVLVTGDGDFTGLVQKLKTRGPRVEVYSFPQNTAKELREAADKFVSIDKRMLIKMSRVLPGPEPTGTAGS